MRSRLKIRVNTWFRLATLVAVAALVLSGLAASPVRALSLYKGHELEEFVSSGGYAALFGPEIYDGPGNNNPQPGYHDNGRGGNTFVNDPCLDPPPPNRERTLQSETEIAVFGKYMVAGWNDSFGFYDREEGLSGYGYSVDGGNTWIDGGGLPPKVRGHGPNVTDGYFGDPVVVVDRASRVFTRDSTGLALPQPVEQTAGEFYYSSIYRSVAGYFTLSVNRGRFETAPPQDIESVSNTRCYDNPGSQGTPETRNLPKERIVWEPPVEAVIPPYLGVDNQDFLDKEWLHVDQATGTLYLTYTRFTPEGSTPIELVRSYDGGRTWTPPTVIVPNLLDTFNQATYPVTVGLPDGGTRVIVFWWSRTFALTPPFNIVSRRIEYAVSDDDGNTFGPAKTVTAVEGQGEPPGYNRQRTEILNAPFADVRGNDVYVTYYSGKPGSPLVNGLTPGPRPSDIFVSASHDGGTTFGPPIKVNDDDGQNTHVFPSVKVNKYGFVFVGWLDRRNDVENVLTDAWANVSKDGGLTYGHDVRQTDVATSWFVRADARPNFGDYNSSDLINENQYVMIWADGRFPPPAPAPQAATPDVIFTIANGLGVGIDPNPSR